MAKISNCVSVFGYHLLQSYAFQWTFTYATSRWNDFDLMRTRSRYRDKNANWKTRRMLKVSSPVFQFILVKMAKASGRNGGLDTVLFFCFMSTDRHTHAYTPTHMPTYCVYQHVVVIVLTCRKCNGSISKYWLGWKRWNFPPNYVRIFKSHWVKSK